MKIEINVASLNDAIKVTKSVCKSDVVYLGVVGGEIKKKKKKDKGKPAIPLEPSELFIYLKSSGKGSSSKLKIDGSVLEFNPDDNDERGFCIPTDALAKVIKSRATISFSYDSDDMSVVSFESLSARKRVFKGSLNTLPDHAIEVEELDHDDVTNRVDFGGVAQEALERGLNNTGIHDVVKDEDVNVWMKSEGTTLHCLSFTDMHAAYVVQDDVEFDKEISFNLPYHTFMSVNNRAKGEPYTLYITDYSLTILNDHFEISVPLYSDNSGAKFEMEREACFDMLEGSDTTAEISINDISQTLDNFDGIHEQGMIVSITIEDGKLILASKTEGGEIREEMECETQGSGRFNVRKELLSDIVTAYKTKGMIKLSLPRVEVVGKKKKLEVLDPAVWFTSVGELQFRSVHMCLYSESE